MPVTIQLAGLKYKNSQGQFQSADCLKGEKGDPGENGLPGAQGPQGAQGIQGPKGDKGDKGDTGETGSQGPKGDKGDTGATGSQGPKGDKGDPGADADPTDLIDDTTPSLTKTFSSSKISTDHSNLLSAIQQLPNVKESDASGIDLDITDKFGNVIARLSDGHVQTKEFNSKETNRVTGDNYLGDLDVTDKDGNVILRLADGHVQTKYFDSKNLLGIVARNKDVVDGVYASCRWHQPTASSKQFCLLMGGDIHGDAPRMSNMIEFLNAVDAFDAGIMLGDIGAWESDATWYTDAIKKTNKPFLTVVGNHDAAGNASTDATSYQYVHDFYEKFIEPNLPYADLAEGEHEDDNVYYFKDFPSHKIRIICINQYDYPPDKNGDSFVYPRGNNCYGQDQIDWFCETLNDTPSDYGVIIALHSFPESMSTDMSNLWVSSTWYGSSASPADIMDHENDGYILPQIVDAWMNGTALQKTFHYQNTGSWTECVVDVDFSSRGEGEFITYIGGHWHMSVLGKCYHYHDQKSYNVDCSGIGSATQGDTPRKEGTRSEDALCVLAVDRTLKTVKLFRIGAHFTKDGKDRLIGQYSYDAE